MTNTPPPPAAIAWHEVAEQPYRHDLFALLRRIEASHPQHPRLGRAQRPGHEPLRIGQEPSTLFAPATLAGLDLGNAGTPPKLRIFSFGLFGPNGPLPLSLTEYARERKLHHGDDTLSAFADLFHHRLTLLFYRAWADAQATVSLDRADDDFSRQLASTLSHGLNALRVRDTVPDHARLMHAGHLTRQVRSAESLRTILANHFGVNVAVEEFVGRWLPLPPDQRTRLGPRAGARLGVDSVAGQAVWDRQHHFRLRLGPMSRTAYERLLPPGPDHRPLRDWVRTHSGIELDWDVRLILRASEVPATTLGGDTRLGWTTWLGGRREGVDADDLILVPERTRQPSSDHRKYPCRDAYQAPTAPLQPETPTTSNPSSRS